MNLHELTKYQNEFQENHGWILADLEGDDLMKKLLFMTVALAGELGEFANLVKKMERIRERKKAYDKDYLPMLKEELTDVFIYLINVCILLGIDLEKEYLNKMEKNKIKFKEFEV